MKTPEQITKEAQALYPIKDPENQYASMGAGISQEFWIKGYTSCQNDFKEEIERKDAEIVRLKAAMDEILNIKDEAGEYGYDRDKFNYAMAHNKLLERVKEIIEPVHPTPPDETPFEITPEVKRRIRANDLLIKAARGEIRTPKAWDRILDTILAFADQERSVSPTDEEDVSKLRRLRNKHPEWLGEDNCEAIDRLCDKIESGSLSPVEPKNQWISVIESGQPTETGDYEVTVHHITNDRVDVAYDYFDVDKGRWHWNWQVGRRDVLAYRQKTKPYGITE